MEKLDNKEVPVMDSELLTKPMTGLFWKYSVFFFLAWL